MSDVEKTFTLAEAQALLPVLEGLLSTAMQAKKKIEEIDSEFHDLSTRIFLLGGMAVELKRWALRRAEREKTAQRIKDAVAEIGAAGVQVKDLDIGLLDFPCVVDSKVILLCWRIGEKTIEHWHGTDEGYAGRKPIDERIAKAKGKE